MPVHRLVDHPIIAPSHFSNGEGDNINGPSLIRVPDWLPNPLGKYYLYFAHHRGRSIRLAYANELHGPWRVYEPGTLQLHDATACHDHIASPDVHLDEQRRQIRMYFHGVVRGSYRQRSFVAASRDGIHFVAGPRPVADFYLRVVRYGPYQIGMSKGGVTYLARLSDFAFRRIPVQVFPMRHPLANSPGDIRHVALQIDGSHLVVYYSKIGDAPEQIYKSSIDLRLPLGEWKASEAALIISPGRDWEGANLPRLPSVAGASRESENGLRDPAIFVENDKTYLLYSVAGESGIGIAELRK